MSRYPNIGNAASPTTRHHSPYFTTTTSIPRSPLSSSSSSRSRHEQQEHQLTSSYQQPRVSSPTMTTLPTLPTLPPISTLPYDSLFSPHYKTNSNEQYRYSSATPLSINTPQSTPTTPYSATSSTSSFSSYLPSPLPQPSTPTQNPPSQPPHSQPSYYQQQRSPQTSYYSQSTFSSYSQYSQTPNSPAQSSPRRTTQQIQHYSSQQQQSPIYGSPHHPHSQSSSTQQSTHTPIRPYQRSHTSQNVISEPFVTVTPELNNRPPRRRRRPPFSYSSLIAQAILDSPDRRLTLREVYQWIMERYPQLYKADDTGWQNTIRHNLSLNKCFKKVPRSDTELGHSTSSSAASKGKGGYWTIDPEYMSSYHDGVFARGGIQKRRPGEVGLHLGMGQGLGDDDSGGSDTSPSDNMAGRLVDVEDDGYHHHPHHHHIHQQQQHYHHHVHHNGMAGSTGERLSLTLTVPPPVAVPSSSSLMTPPLSSGLLQSKSKRLYVSKRHSSEPNFTNLASPSAYVSSANSSGSNSGRYDVFHLTELSDPSSPLDHSNSNRDISPYSIGSRGSGPGPEWDKVKMEIDQGDSRNSYYYGNHSNHSMSPEGSSSRNVIQQAIGEIDSSHSSMAGSSMKIRDLLN